MLAFYPRNVRKIIGRKKHANQSMKEVQKQLSKLKVPRHKNKIKKSMSKMRCLAIS